MLGHCIALALRSQGFDVRSICRATSNSARRDTLQRAGVQLVEADLRDSASLERACADVDGVISTASAMLSSLAQDTVASVDREGQLALIRAARNSKVSRFVYISFVPSRVDFPLQTAKRTVERALADSGIPFMVVQPTYFREVWLSPFLGFQPSAGKIRIYGSGEHKVTFNALDEVVSLVSGLFRNKEVFGGTIQLGGAESVSQLEVVKMAEEVFERDLQVELFPEDLLERALANGPSDVERSRAGLLLSYARGVSVDNRAALAVPIQLSSIRTHLESLKASLPS